MKNLLKQVDRDTIEAFSHSHESSPIGKHRFFSVLVPFVEKDGKLQLLFERRANHMESQPGEICFPGGNMDEGESPLEYALRETYEEIGISKDDIEVLCQGNTLYGYANYTLYTHLAFVDEKSIENAVLSKDEVDEIFTVPISEFTEDILYVSKQKIVTKLENFPYDRYGIDEDYSWRIGSWDIPLYDVCGEKIWGLTARIIWDILHEICIFCSKFTK